jgi:hypothetical protein
MFTVDTQAVRKVLDYYWILYDNAITAAHKEEFRMKPTMVRRVRHWFWCKSVSLWDYYVDTTQWPYHDTISQLHIHGNLCDSDYTIIKDKGGMDKLFTLLLNQSVATPTLSIPSQLLKLLHRYSKPQLED